MRDKLSAPYWGGVQTKARHGDKARSVPAHANTHACTGVFPGWADMLRVTMAPCPAPRVAPGKTHRDCLRL